MSSVVINENISMIVSSDPNGGAINRDALGSYFEVQLEGGLKIPKDAINVEVSVEESAIWWVVPNIITNVNDKMKITGPHKGTTETSVDLGYIGSTDTDIVMTTGPSLIIFSNTIGIDTPMPVGDFIVGDAIQFTSGALTGNSYIITSILQDSTNQKTYMVETTTDTVVSGKYTFSRIRTAGTISDFILTIPQGLYDLGGLNQAILRELENKNAVIDPNPLIILTADEPTQKVELRFNYSSVEVDFTYPNSFNEILGFNSSIYGPYSITPVNILAPEIAKFNQVNYFLIHSDLVNKGIRFNNTYNQTISQVLIDVPPGSQIVSKPFNPAKSDADELRGVNKTMMRFWLTDENNLRVDTNGEYWSSRVVISYQRVLVLDKT